MRRPEETLGLVPGETKKEEEEESGVPGRRTERRGEETSRRKGNRRRKQWDLMDGDQEVGGDQMRQRPL